MGKNWDFSNTTSMGKNWDFNQMCGCFTLPSLFFQLCAPGIVLSCIACPNFFNFYIIVQWVIQFQPL